MPSARPEQQPEREAEHGVKYRVDDVPRQRLVERFLTEVWRLVQNTSPIM